MQTYIDKGELAVKYVIDTREKYADICEQIQLPQPTWESYIQQLMGLDQQQWKNFIFQKLENLSHLRLIMDNKKRSFSEEY